MYTIIVHETESNNKEISMAYYVIDFNNLYYQLNLQIFRNLQAVKMLSRKSK